MDKLESKLRECLIYIEKTKNDCNGLNGYDTTNIGLLVLDCLELVKEQNEKGD